MKKYFLIAIIGLLFVGMVMTSCKKEEIDVRDQYVGTWNNKEVGSLTLYQNGSSIGTFPIDTTYTVNVSKSGDNGLMIEGKLYFVNGEHLTSDPESITETNDGVNIVGTETTSGTLGSNIITINDAITGTWSTNNGENGNLSGTLIATLTK